MKWPVYKKTEVDINSSISYMKLKTTCITMYPTWQWLCDKEEGVVDEDGH